MMMSQSDTLTINPLITDHIDIWTSAILAKSTSGRGSSKKYELYGITKLRELILELAVRGKLVPQDANDEPASILLEKIAAEKDALEKNGTIKKTKPVDKISNDEKPFTLPSGWQWARLSKISHYQVGKTPSTKNPSYWTENSEGIPWVSISDLNHFGTVDSTAKKITPLASKNVFKFEPTRAGTILMSFKLTLGKISILKTDAYHNEAIISLYPFSGISKQYLFKTLPKRALSGNSKQAIMGNTLNSKSLSLLLIPLPPLEEQHRIVAKVDELMLLCDDLEQQTEASIEAHTTLVEVLLTTLTDSSDAGDLAQNWASLSENFDSLFTTEQSIEALKRTVLQLAVMGKLVSQDPNDEPASVLLEKIAEEKERLVKEKKIKRAKSLPLIDDDEQSFKLPQGWEWVRLSTITDLITSGSRGWAKYYSESGAKFITMGNLSRGNYDLRLDTVRHINPPEGSEGDRTKLVAGDIVISITGDVGNLGLIPKDFGEAYINQHACLVRPNTLLEGLYIPEYLRSQLAKDQFDAPQRGIKNSFRLSDVDLLTVPLPPISEQHRIVAKIDELMQICDQLKSKLKQSQTTQVQLTDALVEQALA